MLRKGKKIKRILSVLLVVVLVWSFYDKFAPGVQAGAPRSVLGKAELMNTGDFLYFDALPYNSNVTISDPDPGNGNLRTMGGWAWDTDFGWIDFGDAGHGGPVTVNYATGRLQGMAYITNTGGFIDFDNFNSDARIDTTTGRFTGYGWSNDGGWYDFGTTGVYVEEGGLPNNPTTTNGWDSNAKTTVLTNGGWGNYSAPYFEWSGATDSAGDSGYTSGVAGYWVYWGTDGGANPVTTGAYQTGVNYTVGSAPVHASTYYLRTVTQDTAGNRSSASTVFTYKYDSAGPDQVDYVNTSPVGCSTQSVFTFTWNAVIDPHSGTAGYEYKRGSTGDVATTTDIQIDSTPYQEGDNVFYVRVLDNAGNRSAWQTGIYCSTGLAYIIDGPKVVAGSSSITVSWISDKKTTGYVKVYDGNAYVSEQGHTEFDRTHSVKVIGLEPEKAYRYKLIWVDESGNSGESNWFSTNTTEAPQIYNLQVAVLGDDQALVSWTTTEMASCTVEYGVGNYDQSSTIEGEGTSFTHIISGLTGGTTYQLRVQATSSTDSTKFFGGRDFSTPPLPEIGSISFETSVENAAPSVKISWKTNVDTTSSVFYRVQGSGSFVEISSSDKTSDHEMTINDLADSAIYEVYITGIDEYGNEAKSEINTFTTPLDSRPPKITDIIIESSNVGVGKEDEAQIAVSWKTDEPATSYVEYAKGISGESYTGKTVEDPIQSNAHLVIVSGLESQIPYHLRVCSTDRGNNSICSNDNVAIPGEAPKSILNIILNALRNTFGWITQWLK